MRGWTYFGLVFAALLKWLGGEASGIDLTAVCLEAQGANDQVLIPVCDALASLQPPRTDPVVPGEINLKQKKFLRFGRALAGDPFLRFGRNYNTVPFQDKRFLRFGRNQQPLLEDILKAAIDRLSEIERQGNIKIRRRRSVDTDTAVAEEQDDAKNEPTEEAQKDGNETNADVKDMDEKRFMRFGKNDKNTEIKKRNSDDEVSDQSADKRFMRFGRGSDKRFMRFGRNPESDDSDEKIEADKRFMRFGKKSDDKRFMRFGKKSDDKRFMRFGRDSAENDVDKRFMRFGRDGADKRFMRFGRDNQETDDEQLMDKRFMRFGKREGDDKKEDKRFMRFGRPSDDKRFMRFGRDNADKRFMRFGRDNADKRFMRFGKRFMRFGRDSKDDSSKSDEKRFMRFGKSTR